MYCFEQVVAIRGEDHAIFPFFLKKYLLDIKATEDHVTDILQFAHEMECSLQVEQQQNDSRAH